MVFSPAIDFIDAALTASGDRALTIYDDFKWLIRRHLLALLGDFPNLCPDSGTFIHDDGAPSHLLYVHGELPIPSFPSLLITIWLHESYPVARPMVYVFPKSSGETLYSHPMVAPSGLVTSPYLERWEYPKSNLSELVRSLVRLFRLSHPYSSNWNAAPSNAITSSKSTASRREAMDRLTTSLCLQEMQFLSQATEDTERLLRMQEELLSRAQLLDTTLRDLRNEWLSLRKAQTNKEYDKAALELWLQVHISKPPVLDDKLEAFEPADERSSQVLESKAVDLAIDDVLYVLDEALEGNTISLAEYMKKVRALTREQFVYRARATNMHFPDQMR